MSRRWSKPFPVVLVPVFSEAEPGQALALATQLGAKIHLVGLVQVASDALLSTGAAAARSFRKSLKKLSDTYHLQEPFHASVAHDPWRDLQQCIQDLRPDLVVLDWKAFETNETPAKKEVLTNFTANLAVVRGVFPQHPSRLFVPVRGGPHAQLALRLALALPHKEISAIHFDTAPEASGELSAPFRGLARVLPALPEVKYEHRRSENAVEDIKTTAREADALVFGANVQAAESGPLVGRISAELLGSLKQPVILVKSKRAEPNLFTGPEAERSGGEALSILVDKWFAENTYHASDFDNIRELVRLKEAQNVTISLALPALNEEETVGQVLSTVQNALMHKYPLVDEIVLIDSDSTDRTREIARDLGVPVYVHQELMPSQGARRGKGEALWKSLSVTRGDILVWIDSDIVNIHPRFVYGVLGPMLLDSSIHFVKGFYQRPLRTGRKVSSTGGGRVTELTARPLLNLFYPELSGVLQPLSGEYGGRRSVLENLTFYSGYGVEIGMLIDMYEKYGLRSIAQVDLLERIHHNQSLQALSKMSFVIMQTVLGKLEKRFNRAILEEVNKSMKLIEYEDGLYSLNVQDLVEQERPPIATLPEYQAWMRAEGARAHG